MYRITDRAHTDAILNAVARGIPVRLITEPDQYRDITRMWDAWNVDRLYMGGVQMKMRAHAGLNHQKSVILHDQDGVTAGDQTTVIFGSSNWTSPSANGQVEHNIFTKKPDIVDWFNEQFERKWNNTGGVVENADFVPLPPDAPKNADAGQRRHRPGHHRHVEVVRRPMGTPLRSLLRHGLGVHQSAGVHQSRRRPDQEDRDVAVHLRGAGHADPGHDLLLEGRRQDDGAEDEDERRIHLHDRRRCPAAAANRRRGNRALCVEGTGQGRKLAGRVGLDGRRRREDPQSESWRRQDHDGQRQAPASYFELPFYAEAGRAYRLWLRGKADSNSWANDSVFIQFTNS